MKRNSAQHIPSWPEANYAPTKAEYICANQTPDLIFPLQKRGGPNIYSALNTRGKRREKIFGPAGKPMPTTYTTYLWTYDATYFWTYEW